MTVEKPWEFHDDGRSPAHVWPLDDEIDHDVETDDGCVCGATPEPVKCKDGSVAWVLRHHSLDGRERLEA